MFQVLKVLRSAAGRGGSAPPYLDLMVFNVTRERDDGRYVQENPGTFQEQRRVWTEQVVERFCWIFGKSLLHTTLCLLITQIIIRYSFVKDRDAQAAIYQNHNI